MPEPVREVAVEVARRAGTELRTRRGAAGAVSAKSSAVDLVTETDRAVERLVVAALRARFPEHSLLTEEDGLHAGDPARRWIVDPLDGTTNFVHGVPLFAVSLAFAREGRVEVGVVYDPNLDECFVAERGRGAELGGRPLAVSATARLEDALLATGFPYDVRATGQNLAEYAALTRRTRIVRELGSAALALAWVAAGRLDGYWELRLGPWDVAAGQLLVTEAGGRCTDPDGGPVDLAHPAIAASNGLVHEALLHTLQEARAR